MATIRKQIRIQAAAEDVWAAVREFHQVHERLCPGVLTDSKPDGDARVVTFANGLVVRERLIGIDDATRRLAYSAAGGRLAYHHATLEVQADGPDTSLVWTIDLQPDELAPAIAGLMEAGATAMRSALERPLAA